MEIIDKIKNILNSLEDIKTVMYESAFGANLRVDRKEAPFAIMYTVADYQLDMSRNLKEGCDIEIFFAERGKLGDTGDNDQVIIDRTMGYARQFLAVLRQEKSIVIENDPVTVKSAYGRYDAHLVGVSVELQLRDRQAHCIDYEEPSIKTLTITENGEYDTTQYGKVIVNVVEPEPPVPTSDYFYIKNETQTTGTLTITNGGGTLRYSTDAVNWTDYDFTTHPTISVAAGDKLYLKGVKSNPSSNPMQFSMDVDHSIGGNILSIINENSYSITTNITSNGLTYLFTGDAHLISAADLNFGNAVSVSSYGMHSMFSGCSALKESADFSNIENVEDYGMTQMYFNCSSLKTGSNISNVTAVGVYALQNMYRRCTSLNEAYAPNVSTWGDTSGWLNGVSTSGTLYCPSQEVADLIPDNNASGCPTGWVKRIIQ